MFLQFNIFTRRQLHHCFGTIHLARWGCGGGGASGTEGLREGWGWWWEGQQRRILVSGENRPTPANGPSWNVLPWPSPTPTLTQISGHPLTNGYTHIPLDSSLYLYSDSRLTSGGSSFLYQNLCANIVTLCCWTVLPAFFSNHTTPCKSVSASSQPVTSFPSEVIHL